MAGTNVGGINATNVHVNQLLTNFSIGYHPDGFIAEQAFPVMPVKHENDNFAVWDKGTAFRVDRADGQASKRADGTRAIGVNFGWTQTAYVAQEYAREVQITDRTRANADDVFQLEATMTRKAQDLLLLDQELRVAKLLTTTTNYPAANTVTLSGTGQWNNAAFASQSSATQSVIELNMDTGREAIRIATGGKEPNVVILPRPVARVVARDLGVRDQIRYTDPNILVQGMLPATLWGMKVLIPNGVYDSSIEGEPSVMTDIWGKNAIIAYVDPTPGINTLTAGLIFRARPWQVKQWRDESVDATYYRPSVVQTEVAVAFAAAYLISAAIA